MLFFITARSILKKIWSLQNINLRSCGMTSAEIQRAQGSGVILLLSFSVTKHVKIGEGKSRVYLKAPLCVVAHRKLREQTVLWPQSSCSAQKPTLRERRYHLGSHHTHPCTQDRMWPSLAQRTPFWFIPQHLHATGNKATQWQWSFKRTDSSSEGRGRLIGSSGQPVYIRLKRALMCCQVNSYPHLSPNQHGLL